MLIEADARRFISDAIEIEKEIVECLGNKTKRRISRLRRRLHNVKFIN